MHLEKVIENSNIKEMEIVDIWEEEEEMEEMSNEKYHGHVISRDGRNIIIIKSRVN